jgi:muramoyltetrapeptide carboxypeptidase
MKETADQLPDKMNDSLILPPAVRQGDTIGLVAPSGSIINQDNLNSGIHILNEAGFNLKFHRDFRKTPGYLAGSDQERAEEFNTLWSDPEVKAIIAARGGYGSLRMLDMLDWELIRKNPKILIGFSDITALLTAIFKKTGLVTFHGPVVTTLDSIDEQSRRSFFNTLTGQAPAFIKPDKIKILKNGKAKGRLLGGNLTTLAHLLATPHELSWENIILFIEDVGESSYRLDRLLTHLSQAKRLDGLSGLILGSFTNDKGEEEPDLTKTVYNRVLELFDEVDIPILANFPTGHSRRNLTLPLGINVEIDSSSKKIYPDKCTV